MSSDLETVWEALPSGDMVLQDAGGQWVLLKSPEGWTPVPPNGRSYPYALVATMMQAPCLSSLKHAVKDCRTFLSLTVGDKAILKDGGAQTPDHLAHQFAVTSCGASFSVHRAKSDTTWKAEWSAWDRFGTLENDDLATLIDSFRAPFAQDAGYIPFGLREAIIAEDQRIESRLWTMAAYSAASETFGAEARGNPSEATACANRAVALGEMMTQQARDEARLIARRADSNIYPGLL